MTLAFRFPLISLLFLDIFFFSALFSKFISEFVLNADVKSSEHDSLVEALNINPSVPKKITIVDEGIVILNGEKIYINTVVVIEGQKESNDNKEKIIIANSTNFIVNNKAALALENMVIEIFSQRQELNPFKIYSGGIMRLNNIDFNGSVFGEVCAFEALGNVFIIFSNCQTIDIQTERMSKFALICLRGGKADVAEVIIDGFKSRNSSSLNLMNSEQTLDKIFLKNVFFEFSTDVALANLTSFQSILIENVVFLNCLLKLLLSSRSQTSNPGIFYSNLIKAIECQIDDILPFISLNNIESSSIKNIYIYKTQINYQFLSVRKIASFSLIEFNANTSNFKFPLFNIAYADQVFLNNLLVSSCLFLDSMMISTLYTNLITIKNFKMNLSSLLETQILWFNNLANGNIFIEGFFLANNILVGGKVYDAISFNWHETVICSIFEFQANNFFLKGMLFSIDSATIKVEFLNFTLTNSIIDINSKVILVIAFYMKITYSKFSNSTSSKTLLKGFINFLGNALVLLSTIFEKIALGDSSLLDVNTNSVFPFITIVLDSCLIKYNSGKDTALLFEDIAGLDLFINSSSFINNVLDKHGVMYFSNAPIEKYEFTVNIFNTNFISNTANFGAALYISSYLMNFTFYNCLFANNEATKSGGVFFISSEINNFHFLKKCFFIGNKAFSSAVFHLILGVIIDQNSIYLDNIAHLQSTGRIESYSYAIFQDIIIKNSYSLNSFNLACFGSSTLIIINSSLLNCTAVDKSAGLAFFSRSRIVIQSSVIHNLTAMKGAVIYGEFSSQKLLLEKCNILYSKASVASLFFLSSVKVQLDFINILFNDGILFHVKSSALDIKNMLIVQGNTLSKELSPLFKVEQRANITLDYTILHEPDSNSTSNSSAAFIFISGESFIEVSRTLLNFKCSGSSLFNIENSDVTLYDCLMKSRNQIASSSFSKFVFNRSFAIYDGSSSCSGIAFRDSFFIILHSVIAAFTNSAIKAIDCDLGTNMILNSSFYRCISDYGGAISLRNSHILLKNSSFQENFAKYYGGGLYFDDMDQKKLKQEIINTLFQGNRASIGNAIFWSILPPAIDATTYLLNAKEPDFISSKPFYIFPDFSNDFLQFKSFVPGAFIEGKLKFLCKDYYNSTMVSLTRTKARMFITALLNNTHRLGEFSIIGETIVFLEKGEIIFESLRLTGPLNSLAMIKIEVDLISRINEALLNLSVLPPEIINYYDGQSYEYSFFVTVNFSSCREGQIYNSVLKVCTNCPEGSYSFLNNESSCSNCPENAFCPGGSAISVSPGFWRSGPTSKTIYKCKSREGCAGGIYAYICKPGYSGPLCDVCEHEIHPHYRDIDKLCKDCEFFDVISSVIYNTIFFGCSLLYVSSMIRQKLIRSNSLISDLFKILTNYLQITNFLFSTGLGVTIDINKVFLVNEVIEFIDPINFDGSMECAKFVFDMKINIFFKKLIFLSLTLFGLVFMIPVIGYLLYFRKSKRSHQKNTFCKFLTVAYIIIFYTYQPPVIKNLFLSFKCQSIDDRSYLFKFLSEECWSETHQLLIYYLIVPMLITLALIVPGYFLLRMKARLKGGGDMEEYNFWSGSYKKQFYFWDFLVMSEKYHLIFSLTFIRDAQFIHFFNNTIIFLAFSANQILKPFKTKFVNRASSLSWIAIFTTSVYVTIKSLGIFNPTVILVASFLLILSNFLFLLQFLRYYCLLKKTIIVFFNKLLFCCPGSPYYIDLVTGKHVKIDLKEEKLFNCKEICRKVSLLMRSITKIKYKKAHPQNIINEKKVKLKTWVPIKMSQNIKTYSKD